MDTFVSHNYIMSTRKIILIVSLFFITLTLFRILWLEFHTIPDHPNVSKGELDLRNWDQITEHMITLDGEWEFYPETFLVENNIATNFSLSKDNFIQVPGNWTTPKNQSNTYGYGSYRLRIFVDSNKGQTYGIRIPSIDNASELYINGERVGQSGKPAVEKEIYEPLNTPYTAFFTLDKTDEIEIIIQVANFEYPSSGGIVQSIQFGLAEPFIKKTNFEYNIVIVACIIYLLHALYSFVLFLLRNKDLRFLYFSFMIFCVILATLIEQRLLFAWIPISFEWSIKITYLAMIVGCFSLFQLIKHLISDSTRGIFNRAYLILCVISIIIILILPASYHFSLELLYVIIMLIPCLLAPALMFKATSKINNDNIFLLLAAIAAIGSLIWLIIIQTFRIEMVSYPFDLLIATICFSTYWFKRYFRIFDQSQRLSVELQKADKQKDEFLMNVAHELRNPLHSIINILQSVLANERTKIHIHSTKNLELIIMISRHMSSLLDVLLDLERLKENRIALQPKNVSIHNITEAVIEMVRYMTDGKSMTLVNQITSDFPLVYADKNRLIQILFNLLHNAIKHSQGDQIIISAVVQDEWVKISVSDNGIGIDQENLDKLFDRYEQVKVENSFENSGFGLGLNICKKLVELHGGSLEVSSERKLGTVFTFTVQLASSSSSNVQYTNTDLQLVTDNNQIAATITSNEELDRTDNIKTSGSIKLLAVDDDPMNLKVLQSIFSPRTYEVHIAQSGKEALLMLDTENWDVIIADVMMPKMSGYELTRIIRKRYQLFELPILLLTARSQPEDIVSGFLAGANDYVTKPIEGFELKARIHTLTNLKNSINERLRMEAALLQAQIQPHFLFNTINTIASLGEIDTNRMTELLVEFGNYLRKSFDPKNFEQLVPLQHELGLLQSYLFIEKQRFEDRLNIVWDVDETIDIQIPPLSIQPLVENAIRHGVLKRVDGGTISIQIVDKEEHVDISIIDDGIGMDEEETRKILESNNVKGIGINNTNRRLKQLYGKGLIIHSKKNYGTSIGFLIPK